jgi:hypothetical protein
VTSLRAEVMVGQGKPRFVSTSLARDFHCPRERFEAPLLLPSALASVFADAVALGDDDDLGFGGSNIRAVDVAAHIRSAALHTNQARPAR